MVYRILRWLSRNSVHISFRRIEVEGIKNVPASGPVLLVPNHPNALVDALKGGRRQSRDRPGGPAPPPILSRKQN
jgi:hypothetical protein